MALFTGTRIGADGKRYPADAEDIPADSDEERPRLVPVYGQPEDGDVPVWNAAKARLEWAVGGGGGGGGGGLDEETETRLQEIENLNAEQTTALETVVSSDTVTSLERVTQAEYDALTPDPDTVYVIVPDSL